MLTFISRIIWSKSSPIYTSSGSVTSKPSKHPLGIIEVILAVSSKRESWANLWHPPED